MRTHISKKKEITIRPGGAQKIDHKPIGFWYSIDGDWERWCESEQPDWLEGRFVHRVTLGDERLLRISNVTDLDLFHEQHKAQKYPEMRDFWLIDWQKVADEWDGIEIAPYLWKRRLDGPAHNWYYSWDCASGCIWRPQGVEVTCA